MTRQCRWFQCLALAFVLALGAGVAWGFLGGLVWRTTSSLLCPSDVQREIENLVILRDGTPLIRSDILGNNFSNRTYRALDGTPCTKPFRSAEWQATLSAPLKAPRRYTRLTWSRRIGLGAQTSNGEIWYFIHDGELQGRGYLVGYDGNTRLRVGYIGRDGFRNDEPPIDDRFAVNAQRISGGLLFNLGIRMKSEYEETLPFEGTPTGVFYLVADNGVVLLNLNDRTARVAWSGAGFVSAAPLNGQIVVRTSDRIWFLEGNGKEIRSYPLSEEMRRDDPILLWELPKDAIVLGLLRDRSSKGDVFWLDATGKVTRREHMALLTGDLPKWMPPATENFIGCVVAIPSPGAILVGLGYDTWKRADLKRWRKLWPEWWPGLLGTVVISTVLAIFCYRRQRQYDLPWTGMWVGFVLLFGVPAYLGYLTHRHWPARFACPHCGQPVPHDREACFACGQAFPAPAPKGIEVFA